MNTFIFDLDGTLLPMPDQQKFLDAYIKAVAGKVAAYGYEPQRFVQALLAGTEKMIRNDGQMTNDKRFWSEFCNILGEEAKQLEEVFDDFYRNEFYAAKCTTQEHPLANTCIKLLRDKGYTLALATNPLFPRVATLTRILWAGLDSKDFELITTYEISSYCKPKLEYYKEVLSAIDKNPEECIMVGNDVKEDMCAAGLGMDTFLLKECLICSEEDDISGFRQGGFEELYQLIQDLPRVV